MTTAAVSGIEQALGLGDETPSESEILFPECEVSITLLDETQTVLRIKPWGLGRFVKVQSVMGDVIRTYQQIFAGVAVDKIGEDMSPEMVLRVINLMLPYLRDLLITTLEAKNTFSNNKPPDNLRQFVDELPLAASMRIAIVMLRQNWRHLKNVLGLTELAGLKVLISARPSST